MELLVLTLVAALGLAIGSFLNVVVWRVPRGESIVNVPPSARTRSRMPLKPLPSLSMPPRPLSLTCMHMRACSCTHSIRARLAAA